jgi:hypothetical protein
MPHIDQPQATVTPPPTSIEDDRNLSYYLAQDAYLCGEDDTFTFLNVKSDRYILVVGPDAACVRLAGSGQFLASYGHYPEWVFGVNLDPWSAHCWVQCEQFVLNDDPEIVASYIPILAV